MMKKMLYAVGVLALLLVVGLVVLYLSMGNIVKAGIEAVGPQVTQCPITVDSISVSPLRGKMSIKGLVVGNPEGFKSGHAFKLGEVSVDLDPMSVFSEKVVIGRILVHAPHFSYEVTSKGTNIGKLLDNVKEFTDTLPKSSGEPEPEPEDGDKPVKKLQIDHFVLQEGMISLSATVFGKNVGTDCPLQKMEIKDLGKTEDGITPGEAVAVVLNAVLGNVHSIAKDAINKLTSSTSGLSDGASGVMDSVKGLFGGKKK
ncbi:MAG: hypothetical protein KAI66_12305 [Lentisphaeria bacterium]|nr:hypothetical protein [Lentisphaeria bacterium]